MPPEYPNGTIGLMLYEDGVGDLNGDANLFDRTACILKLATEEATLIQGTGPRVLKDVGGHYFYTLDEAVLGTDLNGDGNSYDWVGGLAVIQ